MLGEESSRLHLLGHRESTIALLDVFQNATAERPTLVLYPSPDAESLTDVAADLRERNVDAVDLVVLDGTWGHARRMYRELPDPLPPHVRMVAFGTEGEDDKPVPKPVFGKGDLRRSADWKRDADPAFWQALANGEASEDVTAPASLLAPVRMYRGPSAGRLCTLESVGIALKALDPTGSAGAARLDEALRSALRMKVDTLRVQNGFAPVYGALPRVGAE